MTINHVIEKRGNQFVVTFWGYVESVGRIGQTVVMPFRPQRSLLEAADKELSEEIPKYVEALKKHG